jgi:meiotically up-regulated gene 157 (Mug157) protein
MPTSSYTRLFRSNSKNGKNHQMAKIAMSALLIFVGFISCGSAQTDGNTYVSQRPPPEKRKFHSDAVEQLIAKVSSSIKDPELAWVFQNCYPNTLDTTVDFGTKDGLPDTFIITGDIDAMWLRDSSAQVQAYLPLCKEDPHLAGLIHRQATCIQLDPYANAFYKDGSRVSQWKSDHTVMKPGVHERKWELDSPCYCIRLAYQYWKITGDATVFNDDWKTAMHTAVDAMLDQQRKNNRGKYSFTRDTDRKTDTLLNDGWGAPIKPTGMICSAFRNSDDATTYLFNIPENLFAVTSLRHLGEILDAVQDKSGLAKTCRSLADEVEQAVKKYGIVDHPKYGKLYAYECDGLGHTLLIDDAGMPGLTSIAYLGYGTLAAPLYQNSRRFAQSTDNPFFYQGAAAEGTGSPHVPGPMIWPMGIIGRAMTSEPASRGGAGTEADSDAEVRHCLEMLKRSQNGTGFMHESFDKDDPSKFSRSWFAWVNNLFGGLIIQIYQERPELLSGDTTAKPGA